MELLGATADPMPGGMEYYVLKHGEQELGGIMQIDPSWGGFHPQWMIYFAVANADETVATIVKLGGKVLGNVDDSPIRSTRCRDGSERRSVQDHPASDGLILGVQAPLPPRALSASDRTAPSQSQGAPDREARSAVQNGSARGRPQRRRGITER